MEIEPYLERIRDGGPREPNAETLRRLHRSHLLAVPFENLDIPLGTPIALSVPAFYDKIVRRRRGGFCYELNGLFAWLLEQLGFDVTLHSARVFQGDHPGPEFDHLVLRVELDEPWIADVGFGDSFLEPLRLPLGIAGPGPAEMQQGTEYRLTAAGDAFVLEERRTESTWQPQFVFTDVPRQLADFEAMCRYQQTSPESSFTRKSVCSIATPDGRLTLSNDRLIVTSGGRRLERFITSEAEYRSLLETRFGMNLDPGARVDRLMGMRPD